MRKAIYVRCVSLMALGLCLGVAACNPKGEEVTAKGDEYSSVFPPVTDEASFASGEMVVKDTADHASQAAAS